MSAGYETPVLPVGCISARPELAQAKGTTMKVLLTLLLWGILLVLCWPLALLALILWPLLWLLSIPFRIVATIMEALLALVKAVLFLPARILGHRDERKT